MLMKFGSMIKLLSNSVSVHWLLTQLQSLTVASPLLGHSLAIDQAEKGHVVVCDADSSQPITGGFTGYGKHVFLVGKS